MTFRKSQTKASRDAILNRMEGEMMARLSPERRAQVVAAREKRSAAAIRGAETRYRNRYGLPQREEG